MNISLTTRIKDIAKKCGIPVSQIERENGFSEKSIRDWDKHRPSIDKVIAVADYFGVSIDTLLGRASGEYLTEDEKHLLSLFRSMSADGQAFLMQSAEMASGRFLKTTASDSEVTA